MSIPNVYKFKIIIVGDTGVGKSCLSYQYTDNKWLGDNLPTIGIDYSNKIIQQVDKTIHLQIWDTAGQETYHSIITSYYRNSCAAIIVYDISNRDSFSSMDKWISSIREKQGLPLIIIGNKKDLNDIRQVSYEEGNLLANRYNAIFSEVSSKSYQEVNDIFLKIVDQLVTYSDQGLLPNDLSERDHNTVCNILDDSVETLNSRLLTDTAEPSKKRCKCCI